MQFARVPIVGLLATSKLKREITNNIRSQNNPIIVLCDKYTHTLRGNLENTRTIKKTLMMGSTDLRLY